MPQLTLNEKQMIDSALVQLTVFLAYARSEEEKETIADQIVRLQMLIQDVMEVN